MNVQTPLAPSAPGNFTRDGAEERPAESKSSGPAVPAKADDTRADEPARLRMNVQTPLAPSAPGNFTRDVAEERPAESKSSGPAVPAKADDTRGDELARLRILEKLALRSENGNVPLPFLMRVLVATATNTASQSPACIILPDVEGIAELVAAIVSIEKLREDWPSLKGSFIKDALRPGISLRSVADGKVIGFDDIEQSNGQEWVSLRYSDAEGRRTQGKLIVQREVIFGLEPTERKRPFLKSGEKPDDPTPTPFDVVADARTCGNTHLIRNRVILFGSRQKFEETLSVAPLIVSKGREAGISAAAFKKFVWGYVDETGKAVVTHPQGATGAPLVAVTRDALLLSEALSKSATSGLTLITSRLELVRRNLEAIQRFAESNRVLLLAAAESRDEARKLRDSGWAVWEPRGWELKIDESQTPLGLPGMHQSLRSLSSDRNTSNVSMSPVRSIALQAAFEHFSALGRLLPLDDVGFDLRLDEMRGACSDLFFSMTSLVQIPEDDERAHIKELTSTIRDRISHAARSLGPAAAEHAEKLVASSVEFLAYVDEHLFTPKGEALLDIARGKRGNSIVPYEFVTGSIANRDRLKRFLETNNETHQCLTVQAVRDLTDGAPIAVFSLMHRAAFNRLMDPRPSHEIVFAGYEFELDLYERRLRYRDRLRDRLGLDEAPRSELTGLPPNEFGNRDYEAAEKSILLNAETDDSEDPTLKNFDSATGIRTGAIRRPTINRKPGEDLVQARFVTFCGSSWAAFTEDHGVLAIQRDADSNSRVAHMDVADLSVGAVLIIRESGDKDVIREMAEHEIGEQAYTSIRNISALWKRALLQSNLSPSEVRRRLARVGINRSLVAVRGWLHDENRIGPRSESDVLGIAETFPLDGATDRDWERCVSAISELRGLHLRVGQKLTGILARQCQTVLIDAAEHEQRVELDFGAAWIVEIGEIDDNLSEWPASSVNRLNWTVRDHSSSGTAEALLEAAL